MLGRYVASTAGNVSEGTGRFDGQLCGGPLQWCNQLWQSAEEGAGKRCSECALHAVCNAVSV